MMAQSPTRDQDVAVLAEVLQHVDVLLVAAAALDQADGAAAGELLDVVDRATCRNRPARSACRMRSSMSRMRHVAAEAAGQRCRCDFGFCHGRRLLLLAVGRCAALRCPSRSACGRTAAGRPGPRSPTRFLRMAPTGQTSTALSVDVDVRCPPGRASALTAMLLVRAAADELEDVLAVQVARGAHAAGAQDAAVAVDAGCPGARRRRRGPGTGTG